MFQPKHCVFVTVPFTDTVNPLMAPAILKSIATQAGKTAATVDLNAVFNRYLNTVSDEVRDAFIAFVKEEKCAPEYTDLIFDFFKQLAEKILCYQPRVVGMSVFTYDCRISAKYLAWFVRRLDPTVKIIMGGSGIMHHFSGRAEYAEELRTNNLIDYYIYGDGEKALYHYLRSDDDKYVGINSHTWLQLTREEIEALPAPDYNDYDFSLYRQPFGLPILGSRGCVRQCTFCDVHVHWERFTYRSGEHIFREMVEFHEKFGIKKFYFTDSLINGNLREYRSMVSLLADYNRDRAPGNRITWGGFFIFRSQQAFTENDWRLTAESGGTGLNVGIETTNDQVRRELGKNFTNEDIEFSFQMAQKYGSTIKFNLLFVTGYPTETDADYEYQVQWWRDQVRYKDVIYSVNSGTPLGILANTPLERDFDKLGLVRVGPNPEDWINPANGNTPEKRIQWNSMIVDVLQECGYQNLVGHDTHYILERMKIAHD